MGTASDRKYTAVGILGGLVLLTIYAAVASGVLAGLSWVYSGKHRCINAWDAKFQPRYEAWQCSIMQRGFRVPIPDFYSMDDVESPEARD